jgi:hypothetical protein
MKTLIKLRQTYEGILEIERFTGKEFPEIKELILMIFGAFEGNRVDSVQLLSLQGDEPHNSHQEQPHGNLSRLRVVEREGPQHRNEPNTPEG